MVKANKIGKWYFIVGFAEQYAAIDFEIEFSNMKNEFIDLKPSDEDILFSGFFKFEVDKLEAVDILAELEDKGITKDFLPAYLVVFNVENKTKYHLEFKKIEENTTE